MSDVPRMRWRALGAAVLKETRAGRGRLVFFTLCLAIGVAAVVGVSALVRSVEAGIRSQSRALLAADLAASARRPLPDELDRFFDDVSHESTSIVEMGTMASVEGDSRLVELKVVDGTYPFYGELVLEPAERTLADLDAGSAFVGPDLALAFGLKAGDELSIGGQSFRVAGEVLDEPDRLDFAFTLGPRVFLTAEGLARTDLLAVQSRARYRKLVRLVDDPGAEALAELEERLRAALGDPPWLSTSIHTQAQPNVQTSLGRVDDFLGLVALLSLLLGGIGVSQIVRAWLAGRAQVVAVLRCLGFRAGEVAVLYLGSVAILALAGCLVGGLLGALLPWGVSLGAPELFQGGVKHLWQPVSVLRGVALGLFVALLFSLPPLTSIWRVPPAAVLRAEAVPLPISRRLRIGAVLALFLGVLISARVQGGAWLVAGAFSVGLCVLAGLLFGAARLGTWLAGRIPRGRLGPHLEHGLAAMARPDAGTAGAIVALGLGVMVVVSMLLVEGRMDAALRSAVPDDAPSVFLVDVQPDQWDGVRSVMQDRGAAAIDSVPVVMARLESIDGRSTDELAMESEDDGRGAWVFTREQRLTWLEELAPDNEIVEGALWSDPERDEVSLELDFAEDLGVGLGSSLVFDVQGIPVELTVTSLRTVEWQSFGINFFLVVEPGVLEDAPHFRIAAARVEPPDAEIALQNELAAAFPNVTVMRVRPILEKIADMMARMAFGVRSLGSFTILAGLVILAGAIATGALRRSREAALLKVLGVTRPGVAKLFAVEYALSGLLAGALGAVGAMVLAWAFLEELARLESDLSLLTIPAAALVTALFAIVSGLAASARVLRARPLEALRG